MYSLRERHSFPLPPPPFFPPGAKRALRLQGTRLVPLLLRVTLHTCPSAVTVPQRLLRPSGCRASSSWQGPPPGLGLRPASPALYVAGAPSIHRGGRALQCQANARALARHTPARCTSCSLARAFARPGPSPRLPCFVRRRSFVHTQGRPRTAVSGLRPTHISTLHKRGGARRGPLVRGLEAAAVANYLPPATEQHLAFASASHSLGT